MTFLYPQALILLVLAAPIIAWWRTSFSHLSGPQKVISLALRLVILLILVLALSGARFRRVVDRMGVMFVVDVSDSIPARLRDDALKKVAEAIKEKGKNDITGLVLAGKEGAVDIFPSGAVSPEEIEKPEVEVTTSFTNLADGVRLAASSFPPGVQKRVVLITDGAENVGDVVSEVSRASQEGAEVVTVPLKPYFDSEAKVESVYTPAGVGEGETVGLRMVLASTVAQKARVVILADGNYLGESEVEMSEGKNAFSYPVAGLAPGFHAFSVLLEPEKDTMPENNRAFSFTRVAGRAGVLIASNDRSDTRALDGALLAHKIAVRRVIAQGLPLDLAEWLSYDSVILSDIPAYNLSENQMNQIASAVSDFGHGLIMTGGEDSFGPGGYYKTKIEEALPVSMEYKKHALSPNVAMVLLVDKSGSMGVTYNGYGKMALAREACIATVELCDASDYVGVLIFDSFPKWVVPLAKNTDKDTSFSRIRQVMAGGGTEIYPALVETEKVIGGVDAKIKHVIILSDGMSAPGDFSGIIGKLTAEGATVSTVAIGDDADLAFMKDIAKAGGGNAYFTNDPYDLPRIFTRETFLANKGTIVETDFQAAPQGASSLTSGIDWGASPALSGYVATSGKPTAELPLLTPQADPLLASWRYGLGKSVAWTSDAKNRWAARWLSWGGFEKFWSGIVRSTSAGADNPGWNVDVGLEGENATVEMSIADTGMAESIPDTVEARVVGPDTKERKVKLDLIAPNRWRGEFPVVASGTYMVNVVGNTPDGVKTAPAGLAVSYSPEYKKLGGDDFTLSRLAALSLPMGLSGADLFQKGRKPQVEHDSAWELLILLAVYLWILDVAIRRVSWSREYLEMAEEAWQAYMGRVRAARIRRGVLRENISVGKLLERSRDVRSRIGVARGKDREGADEDAGVERKTTTSAASVPGSRKQAADTPDTSADRAAGEGVVWHKTIGPSSDDGLASYRVKARKKIQGDPEPGASENRDSEWRRPG